MIKIRSFVNRDQSQIVLQNSVHEPSVRHSFPVLNYCVLFIYPFMNE